MSLRVVAVMSHCFNGLEEILEAPTHFAGITNQAMQVAREYWSKPDPDVNREWRWWESGDRSLAAEWDQKTGPSLDVPGDGSMVFGTKCLYLHTIAKWFFARTQPSLVRAAFDLSVELAQLVHSSCFLLLHDQSGITEDWVLSGMSIEEIEKALFDNGFESANCLEDLFIAPVDLEKNRFQSNLFYEHLMPTPGPSLQA